MRLAWEICHKTKPEITQIAREILANQRLGRIFMESFTSSMEFLKDMSKMFETAEARFLSAALVAELEAERTSRKAPPARSRRSEV